MLGIVGGEGCKIILDELKFLSKQGTKQSSPGSTSPDEDGRCPIPIFLLTVSSLSFGACFSFLTQVYLWEACSGESKNYCSDIHPEHKRQFYKFGDSEAKQLGR